VTLKKNDLTQATQLIRQAFDLSPTEWLPEGTEFAEEELLIKLEQLVSYLLDKDLEKLLQVLYRIDADERKVKLILANESPERLSRTMAELILERQKMKLKYRNLYRGS